MWSSTVSQNSKFTNPKPYRVILYYSGVENSSQISSGGKMKLPILFPACAVHQFSSLKTQFY